MEAYQLSRYSETDGRPLLLDNRTNMIMSWILNNEGEKKVHEIFRHLLSAGCDPSKVFVDVGANAGFYSLVALSYGCQVLAFDPQPACAQLFKRNMCLNAHYPSMVSGTGIAVVNRPVSDVSAYITMMVASTAATPICEGTFSVDRQHKSAVNASAGTSGNATAAAAAAAASFTKTTVSLDELLLDSTLQLHLVKIDTEGFELSVLRSMRRLLAAKRVAHMMVEVTPLFWARDGVARDDVYKVFLDLLELNCTVQRALEVVLPSNMQLRKASDIGGPRFDTPAKLTEYLVERDFVQEDVYVSCPLT